MPPKVTIAPTTSTQDGWADDGDDTNGPRQVFSTPQFSAIDWCSHGVGEVRAVAWLFDGGRQLIPFQRNYTLIPDPANPGQLLGVPGTPIPNPGTFELASLPVAERDVHLRSILSLAFH
jgi:hypothetical protein